MFDTNTTQRDVPENTPPGVNIGAPISATDDDEDAEEFGDTLTYSLEGTNAASFDIDPSTGQLITKAPLDFEADAGREHGVTVKVEDGNGGDDTIEVTINVENVNEPPAAPIPPTVVSGEDDSPSDETEESTTSLKVVWHAPENTGPAISGYDVGYKKSTETSFGETRTNVGSSSTTTGIPGLEANTIVRCAGARQEL